MEENLHFPVFPPDGAELPLKPGWRDAVLLSSEPLDAVHSADSSLLFLHRHGTVFLVF